MKRNLFSVKTGILLIIGFKIIFGQTGGYRGVNCRELSSGIYFLMTTIIDQNSARKIVLIK